MWAPHCEFDSYLVGPVLSTNPSHRYNAPEVAQQKLAPIEWENLHKCDIWAYGLLVWEILANGEIYFKRKWRHDPELARTAREALSGTTMGDSRSPTTGEPTEEESIQPEEEGVMGTFDSRFLRNLAIQFANKMTLPMFEKGCLRALLRLTLQEDPSARLSDLNSSPIVSVWNHSGSSSLQHKLAMHVGTSEFTFDVWIESPYLGRASSNDSCRCSRAETYHGNTRPRCFPISSEWPTSLAVATNLPPLRPST